MPEHHDQTWGYAIFVHEGTVVRRSSEVNPQAAPLKLRQTADERFRHLNLDEIDVLGGPESLISRSTFDPPELRALIAEKQIEIA